MSALGHYLEAEGIATVSISLIREHSAAIEPPRALAVPFMLGRPLGVPNDPAFQKKVLVAALALLERADGPVILEDFTEDAPYEDLGAPPEGLVCPVNFPAKPGTGSLAERLQEEIAQLAAWHDVALKHRGRTTLGVTGLTPAQLGAFVAACVTDDPVKPFRAELGAAPAIKLATDELKAYYYEAKSVQPGRHRPTDMLKWFFTETVAGEAFVAVRDKAAKSDDPTMKGIATLSVVPRAAVPLLAGR